MLEDAFGRMRKCKGVYDDGDDECWISNDHPSCLKPRGMDCQESDRIACLQEAGGIGLVTLKIGLQKGMMYTNSNVGVPLKWTAHVAFCYDV
jgi:hypothetical protein